MHRLPGFLLALLILTAVIGLTFGQVLGNQFVNFDDQSEIIENPDFNPVTFEKLQWNWSHTRLSLYMPVTYFAWGAIAAIAGRSGGILQPMAFHALNLALHLICSLLVYLLILQLWRRRGPAVIGAIAFAVHPLQVEPVAWASGMYTLLSTGLCLGALNLYAARARCGQTFNAQRSTPNVQVNAVNIPVESWRLNVERWTFALFLLATLLYILALLTKAASVSLPLAAAVIDLLILGRPLRKVLRPLGFWMLLGLPIVLLAKHFQDVSSIATVRLWGRPLVALDALGFYFRKIVLPIRLIPDYGRNPTWVMQHPGLAALSILIAVACLLCAWTARRNLRWVAASIALVVAGVCPYLGLTAFDFQYVSTVADRYAYSGMLGVAVFAAAAAVRSRAATVALLIACAAWAVLSHFQVQRWHDTHTLFDYTLAINPRSLISHNVFGFLDAKQGHRAEAEAHYLAALAVWPEDAEIHFNLGNLYLAQRPETALRQYELAVSDQPNFPAYRNNLAVALDRLGHPREAFDQWQQAIAIDPNYTDARMNRASMFMRLHQFDAARADYQAVLRIDPANAQAAAKLQQLNEAR